MIWVYNKIVKNKNNIHYASQNIDIQLKKRFEALPNIATTVKKYLAHEKDLHSDIARLRNQYKTTSTKEEGLGVEQELSELLSTIMVNVENYPELKSNESILLLQRSINEFAEQISASQRAYNNAVVTYNNSISVFPNNIIASMFGFKKEEYISVITSEKEKENIDLNTYL